MHVFINVSLEDVYKLRQEHYLIMVQGEIKSKH
jgi:hypothetical protein